MRPEELAGKSKKDLLELARKHDVPGRSAMSKEELVRAVVKASAQPKGREAKGQPRAVEPREGSGLEPHAPTSPPDFGHREAPPPRTEPEAQRPPERPEQRRGDSESNREAIPPRQAPPAGRPVPPRGHEGPRRGIPPVDPAMKLSRVEEIRKSVPGRHPNDRHGRRGPGGPHEGSARPPLRGGDRYPQARRDHDERSLQAREHMRRSGDPRGPYTPQYRDRDRDRDRNRDRGPSRDRDRDRDRGRGRDRDRDRDRDRGRDRRGIEPPRTAPIPERFVTPPPPQQPSMPPPSYRAEESRGGHPLEMPRNYGVDSLAMMVRDPYWIHAYWEITPASIERAREQLAEQWEGHRWILRMHTFSEGNGEPSPSMFEIDLNAEARNWYIRVPHPDCSYEGMIGILTRDGTFYPFARSNRIRTPRDAMSDETDVQWATTQEEYQKIYQASGGYLIGTSATSGEAREALRRRHEEALFSGMLGSMGSGAMLQRQRGFWFQVNTELILYGATEPDAKVTVQGRPIQLRQDGTFTLRFQLPDGVQELACSATSADGISKRTITPVVRRHTSSEEVEIPTNAGESH